WPARRPAPGAREQPRSHGRPGGRRFHLRAGPEHRCRAVPRAAFRQGGPLRVWIGTADPLRPQRRGARARGAVVPVPDGAARAGVRGGRPTGCCRSTPASWCLSMAAIPPEAGAPSTVSVVIACDSRARSIPGCLDSVLSQDGVGVEVLLVDDDSKDWTSAVVAAAARADVRVRVVACANGGSDGGIAG